MKTFNGIIIGLLLGLMIGFAAGYNHGRGAPLLTNPFEPYNATSKIERQVEELVDEARRAIHDATEQ